MAVRFTAESQAYTRALGLGSRSALTLMCWAKISVDRDTFACPLVLDNNVASDSLGFETSSTGTLMRVLSDNAQQWTLGEMAVGSWYFLAAAIDSAAAGRGYIRTEAGALSEVALSSMAGPWTVEHLRIGRFTVAGEWFNGCVAGVKLYTAALSQAEVQQESVQYVPARTADLQAWYPLLTADPTDQSFHGQTLSGGVGVSVEDGPAIPWLVDPAGSVLHAGRAGPTAHPAHRAGPTMTGV